MKNGWWGRCTLFALIFLPKFKQAAVRSLCDSWASCSSCFNQLLCDINNAPCYRDRHGSIELKEIQAETPRRRLVFRGWWCCYCCCSWRNESGNSVRGVFCCRNNNNSGYDGCHNSYAGNNSTDNDDASYYCRYQAYAFSSYVFKSTLVWHK